MRILGFFVSLIILTTLAAPLAARSQGAPRTISVSGSGSVAVTPDMVTIRVGVSSRDASPAKALQDNTARATKLFATLDKFGLNKRDIQTGSFNVTPVYPQRRPTNTPANAPRTIEFYTVSNMISVRLRDLDKLGALLEALINDGANRLNGLSFGVSEMKDRQDDARKLAIQDAMRKAELYAKEADIDVGEILKISESGNHMPRPTGFATSRMFAQAVPIAAGEQQISASVNVVFEID